MSHARPPVTVTLDFPVPPDIPLWRAALHRGAGIAPGQSIPPLLARAARIPGDAEAYRRVCGFAAADPLPPTWPAVAARGLQLAVMTAASFPLPVLGIVHVRQQIRWTRPLAADEPLAACCRVEGHRVVRGGGEVDLHTDVTAGAEVVWSAVTTILSRAIPGDGVRRPRPELPIFVPTRTATWTLPADHGRTYAAVSGDWNPIHVHPLTARMFGFRRPIMHGWWLLARALAELGDDLPRAGSLDVRFFAPVALPGAVSFAAGPDEDGTVIVLQAPETCVVGWVRPLVGPG